MTAAQTRHRRPFEGARSLQQAGKFVTTSTAAGRAIARPAVSATRVPPATAPVTRPSTAAHPVPQSAATILPPPPLASSTPDSEEHPMSTPLIGRRWAALLRTHPCKLFVDYVVSGICHGFSIGFSPSVHQPGLSRARNLSSSLHHRDFVDTHLATSVSAGQTAGPFNQPPFRDFVCSGVGVVPKKSGKLRLIHHLSAPRGTSINDGIPKELYSLHYITVDHAIDIILRLGKGCLLAKLDIRNAFRLCPVRPEDHHLLGIHWRNQYYYDLVLPFGLRSAPYIFNQVAEALQWICREHFSVQDLIHLLDDYLTAGPPASTICQHRLSIVLDVCKYLGVPIAPEKLVYPTTSLTFLGIELDTVRWEARLPDDKLAELRSLLHLFTTRHSCTKRDLLSLLGKLNFAASVVVSARTFMRRLWDCAASAHELYHHVKLSGPCKADLQWWKYLLSNWNGRSFFLHPRLSSAASLHLYTDAAGSVGYGAYLNGSWFCDTWTEAQQNLCIQYMELYPIALACSTWGPEWSSKRIEFHSDNQAVVASLRSGTCRCANVMGLLRALFIVCAINNFTITASYIPGKTNRIADCLSRQNLDAFRRLAPSAAANPVTPRPLPAIPGETSTVPCASTRCRH